MVYSCLTYHQGRSLMYMIIQVSNRANRRHDKGSICQILAKALHVDFIIFVVRNTVNLWYHRTCKIQKTFHQCLICNQITNYHIACKRGIPWAEYQIQYMTMQVGGLFYILGKIRSIYSRLRNFL